MVNKPKFAKYAFVAGVDYPDRPARMIVVGPDMLLDAVHRAQLGRLRLALGLSRVRLRLRLERLHQFAGLFQMFL